MNTVPIPIDVTVVPVETTPDVSQVINWPTDIPEVLIPVIVLAEATRVPVVAIPKENVDTPITLWYSIFSPFENLWLVNSIVEKSVDMPLCFTISSLLLNGISELIISTESKVLVASLRVNLWIPDFLTEVNDMVLIPLV